MLHAGFYYAPDSLKAKLTQDGNRILKGFYVERGVDFRETGKVVVTTSESQWELLDHLFERGQANGVTIERIDEHHLKELELLARSHLWQSLVVPHDCRC